MCGIAGLAGPLGPDSLGDGVSAMLARLIHRGPDDEGRWLGDGVALGQRRLAVIDLSPAGRQPMVSASGRFVLTINGEIYNFEALRRQVDAARLVRWRGHADSEVLLEAIDAFGIDDALASIRGQFALALWDQQERRLTLARDRFGEKPLCYAADSRRIAFASELTALAAAPGLELSLSPEATSLFFRYGYVPAPLTIYREASKLEPGCRLDWRAGEGPRVTPYWRLGELVETGNRAPIADEAQAAEELDGLLRQAVGEQTVADVPLGVFLSGGLDSSTVAAVMQQVCGGARTFTVGFSDPRFDEARAAAEVARVLGTDHTEHYFSEDDALAVAPTLGRVFDEPFADPSQIPSLLLARMAREHVTVALSGDGGDELFGGYVRYQGAPRLWHAIRRAPLRGCAAALAEAAPLGVLERGFAALGPVADAYAARGRLGPGIRRAAGWIGARSAEDLYERVMSAWPEPADILTTDSQARPRRPCAPAFADPLAAMQWRDAVDYLPGDILAKVDRSAMAWSLETRAPLLDPRIAAFAWRLPADMKIRGGVGKWLLRQVLGRYLPQELIDRPKVGFTPPLHAWLAGPLRAWAESLIGEAALASQSVIDARAGSRLWRRFLAGDGVVELKLWTMLMFRAFVTTRAQGGVACAS
ncbi:MAG TPA: asparagine synthase (glutamine-hydrolyzing) [Caulobacteraceae bacterium]|nr:asparagine synthase (glutamine-hydrolyzing) [Caulobacteraceae bacterium]